MVFLHCGSANYKENNAHCVRAGLAIFLWHSFMAVKGTDDKLILGMYSFL